MSFNITSKDIFALKHIFLMQKDCWGTVRHSPCIITREIKPKMSESKGKTTPSCSSITLRVALVSLLRSGLVVRE
jgi:hypothetical protein